VAPLLLVLFLVLLVLTPVGNHPCLPAWWFSPTGSRMHETDSVVFERVAHTSNVSFCTIVSASKKKKEHRLEYRAERIKA
jgi:hypothetical protein